MVTNGLSASALRAWLDQSARGDRRVYYSGWIGRDAHNFHVGQLRDTANQLVDAGEIVILHRRSRAGGFDYIAVRMRSGETAMREVIRNGSCTSAMAA